MKLFKKISKKKFIITVIVIFIFFFSFISYFSIKIYAEGVLTTSVKKSIIISSLPVNIKIPKIKINADIEHVGLTSDGAVDSPIGPDDVAWFNKGPIPGEIGNAIMDGHSGWKNNIPAVFDNLKKLKKGDKIYIKNDVGKTNIFVVKKLKIYSKNDVALDVFNATDKKSHLNLISCTGIWNVVDKGRESRIVVFADLVL